ncbi:hypothetical protein BCR33DRAFT_770074 [Rhizoclosmatium globosum]|uniref:Uncharacterized protein n=1 Tax=Rhizoclosmatium globosum TaxID=329046 RepID=A0A1Y2BRW7_9FUNG|nr:hypothetical protein BCR33DRAFT_770074 [Rhizoclosmatium globosum]|eukprot:ORY36875.1 hypothetical protein BCR33DRAFT_770074 [Rhizoclosmatium globosum]
MQGSGQRTDSPSERHHDRVVGSSGSGSGSGSESSTKGLNIAIGTTLKGLFDKLKHNNNQNQGAPSPTLNSNTLESAESPSQSQLKNSAKSGRASTASFAASMPTTPQRELREPRGSSDLDWVGAPDEASLINLKSNLLAVQKDLDEIAVLQQLRITQIASVGVGVAGSSSGSTAVVGGGVAGGGPPQIATPPLSPLIVSQKPPSRNITIDSRGGATTTTRPSRKSIASSIGPDTTETSLYSGSDTQSLNSFQTADTKIEQEYYALLEEQGRGNPQPLMKSSGLGISVASALSPATISSNPSIEYRPPVISSAMSPVPPLGVSKKLLEEAEKSVLAVQLGDGYPDVSSLLVGEGGRLLLPSERKKLEGSGLSVDDLTK